MQESGTGFRGAVFGGFKREDVLHYIETSDARYHEETESLRQQLAETQSALQKLREQNETLSSKNAALLEQLSHMSQDTDQIRAQLDEIETGFTAQAAEMEAQTVRAEALAAENERLTEENARLAGKCGEYDATKDKLAEMELSAYRRAKQIEEDAKKELQKLRRQSAELIDRVRRHLDTTKENYRTVLARSQQESADMQRRANEVMNEIDRIAASLGKSEIRSEIKGETGKNGLRDVLSGLRPKTEE